MWGRFGRGSSGRVERLSGSPVGWSLGVLSLATIILLVFLLLRRRSRENAPTSGAPEEHVVEAAPPEEEEEVPSSPPEEKPKREKIFDGEGVTTTWIHRDKGQEDTTDLDQIRRDNK